MRPVRQSPLETPNLPVLGIVTILRREPSTLAIAPGFRYLRFQYEIEKSHPPN